MLTRGPRMLTRGAGRRTGLSAVGRRTRAVAAALAAGLAALVVVGGIGPARADSVRNTQAWVLNDLNAQAAWPISRGAGVTVALIDSGVDPNVPDLAGSVTSGPDLTGVSTSPSNPNWGVHGTWMASLISGHGHNGGTDGIIGVAPQSRVLSIRVITDRADPGYAAYQRQPLSMGQQELARAIRYAVRHKAGVISMSLSYSAQSRPVRAALQEAYAHNVVVVASTGNAGSAADAGRGSAPYSFPADYPGVLGVGAIGRDFQPASFSSDNISVQVAAPGVNVPTEGRDTNYWLVSGTSPACALTAGVAALIKSKYPALSAAEVALAITTSTWHQPAGGWDRQVGFGTVDATAALTTAGRLATTEQASRPVAAVGHFGGGPRAIPAAPVPPRGALAAVEYGLLALVSLVLIGFSAWRLLAGRPAAAGLSGRTEPSAGWPPPSDWERPGPPAGPAGDGRGPHGPPGYDQGPDYGPPGYDPLSGYDGPAEPEPPPGYGLSAEYGQPPGHGQALDYDRPPGSNPPDYPRSPGYSQSAECDQPPANGQALGYDQASGYGQPPGHGPSLGYGPEPRGWDRRAAPAVDEGYGPPGYAQPGSPGYAQPRPPGYAQGPIPEQQPGYAPRYGQVPAQDHPDAHDQPRAHNHPLSPASGPLPDFGEPPDWPPPAAGQPASGAAPPFHRLPPSVGRHAGPDSREFTGNAGAAGGRGNADGLESAS